MEKILKDIIEELLRETAPLSEMPSPSESKFVNVLLGVYRISLATLRDIYYLSQREDTGLNVLDLSRKIIEYGIAIEYMIFKGKEKMAARFQDHLWVQTHQELEFLKSIGEVPAGWNSELKQGANDAEKLYEMLNSDTKKNVSWAGISAEKMLEELYASNALEEFDYSRIGQLYVWGCRVNHPNAFIVFDYMNEKTHKPSNQFFFRLGILTAMLFHIQMTKRYIKEIQAIAGADSHSELLDKINAIWKRLNNLGTEQTKDH